MVKHLAFEGVADTFIGCDPALQQGELDCSLQRNGLNIVTVRFDGS